MSVVYKTELFHCLTRNSPEFRRGIYKLIGFNVADQDYVFAPEECLADNFAYAVIYGTDGREYKSPQLIADIINFLKNY